MAANVLFLLNEIYQMIQGGNCDALQLEGRPTSCQSFSALITRPIIMHQSRPVKFQHSFTLGMKSPKFGLDFRLQLRLCIASFRNEATYLNCIRERRQLAKLPRFGVIWSTQLRQPFITTNETRLIRNVPLLPRTLAITCKELTAV